LSTRNLVNKYVYNNTCIEVVFLIYAKLDLIDRNMLKLAKSERFP